MPDALTIIETITFLILLHVVVWFAITAWKKQQNIIVWTLLGAVSFYGPAWVFAWGFPIIFPMLIPVDDLNTYIVSGSVIAILVGMGCSFFVSSNLISPTDEPSKNNLLDRLLVNSEQISRLVVWIGGGLLIFAAVLTTAEVFLRKFANFSFGGADEIAGYIFAISTSFAFAFATLHRAHVRIDALYLRLPKTVQLFLDVLGFLLLGGFLLLMAERAFNVWWNSYENDSVSITPLVTPLAIPQGLWVAGMIFFFIVFALMVERILWAIYSREWNRIAEVVGPRGIEEEVEEEREHALAELEREHSLMKDKEGD